MIYQVDAFTDTAFKGNPAAVYLLTEQLSDETLQLVAMEMNLSETAFVHPLDNSDPAAATRFSLRWFTPSTEVPLCGHATLASAKVLFDEVKVQTPVITFETLSGELFARNTPQGIRLDFPTEKPQDFEVPAELLTALGIAGFKKAVYGKNICALLLHVDEENEVKNLNPDFEALKRISFPKKVYELVITAQSAENHDFMSRCFCPWIGIAEDPVTGATHTLLAPYWSELLGKTSMQAYQASKRGGEMHVLLAANNRTELTGKAVVTVKGQLTCI